MCSFAQRGGDQVFCFRSLCYWAHCCHLVSKQAISRLEQQFSLKSYYINEGNMKSGILCVCMGSVLMIFAGLCFGQLYESALSFRSPVGMGIGFCFFGCIILLGSLFFVRERPGLMGSEKDLYRGMTYYLLGIHTINESGDSAAILREVTGEHRVFCVNHTGNLFGSTVRHVVINREGKLVPVSPCS